jgi:ferredoxin-nitrite reductase
MALPPHEACRSSGLSKQAKPCINPALFKDSRALVDVGLQGCTKKVDGALVEHFDVFLGGALGDNQSAGARFNRRIKRVAAEEVAPAIQSAMAHYQARRHGNESFADFCARHTDDELAEIL